MKVLKKFINVYFPFKKNRKLGELVWVSTMHGFAMTMLNVFIPIYLIKLGYSIQAVVVMYFMGSLTHVLLVIPQAKMSARFGFKKMNFLGNFLFIIFLFMLYTIHIYAWPLILLAVIKEIGSTFYYIWAHVHITDATKDKFRGRQIGGKSFVTSVLKLPAPVIGGLILGVWGIKFLLPIVCLLLIASYWPFLFSRDIYQPHGLTINSVFKRRPWKHYIVFALHGIDNVLNSFAWPIFAFFLILNNYTVLGFVVFLSTFFSFVLDLLVGRSADKSREKVMRFGAIVYFFVWIAKAFIRSKLGVYVADSFNGLANKSIDISFNAKSYDIASHHDMVGYLIFREVMIHSGRLIIYTFLYVIANWAFIFLGSAALYLMYFLF